MSPTLSTPMRALKITEHHTADIREVPLPRPREDYVLMKVRSVALNPAIWKHIDDMDISGATVDEDLCGDIIHLDSASPLPPSPPHENPGTRTAAFVHGGWTSRTSSNTAYSVASTPS